MYFKLINYTEHLNPSAQQSWNTNFVAINSSGEVLANADDLFHIDPNEDVAITVIVSISDGFGSFLTRTLVFNVIDAY